MDQSLISVCDALDELVQVVLNSSGEERVLKTVHGWHHPAITKHDLASIPKNLSISIRTSNIKDIDEKLKKCERISEEVDEILGESSFLLP